MRGIFIHSRPILRVETLVLIVVVYLIVTANGPWWAAMSTGHDWSRTASWMFMAACFLAVVAAHFALLAAVMNRWIVKPVLTLVVLATVATAYYMRAFAVIMDQTMIQNILHTDWREVRDLLSWSFVGAIALESVLPLAFIWWVKIRPQPWLRSLLIRVASLAVAVLVAGLAALLVAREFTSLMRNQHEIRYLITPGNLLAGFYRELAHGAKQPAGPRLVVGGDARLVRPAGAAAKPRVFVLIVGETARAANFSLFGYGRNTNPELARRDIIAFADVTSCGTSTEVSVPCMFSPFGRADYDEQLIRSSEGLLDVLVRAGYVVRWLDNQSGCKGVCQGQGIEYEKLDAAAAPGLCKADECLDEALARRLQTELAAVRGDTVFVLHMMGNHGPAYFKRYPREFRRFVPDCATAELRDCSRDEVVNSYDNAILYSDHVLADIVDVLQSASARLDTGMWYVSDHGESLGEDGLYLHGMPYSIAPKFQTHVPMVVWLSAGLAASAPVDVSCLRARTGEKFSHDNLFHSVLGLLDVQTTVYRRERDIFAGCRNS